MAFFEYPKSEIISSDPSICKCLSSSLPGAPVIAPSRATLLGSPIGDNECVSAAIQDKVNTLQRMSDHLAFLSAHDALLLLRSSFSIPKLLYLLQSAPCFASDTLKVYDLVLASTLSKITNTLTLPVQPGSRPLFQSFWVALESVVPLMFPLLLSWHLPTPHRPLCSLFSLQAIPFSPLL